MIIIITLRVLSGEKKVPKNIVDTYVADGFAKGHLSIFQKGRLLHAGRACFALQKTAFAHIGIQDVMRQTCNGVPGGSGQPCTQSRIARRGAGRAKCKLELPQGDKRQDV